MSRVLNFNFSRIGDGVRVWKLSHSSCKAVVEFNPLKLMLCRVQNCCKHEYVFNNTKERLVYILCP
jgi:hypothetical protein